jgi:hypothetical protein
MKASLIAALAMVLVFPCIAKGHDKKKPSQVGMLESMQSIPCGAKERGLTGLGAMVGSVGLTHVNSDEKLCPQYLLRTDDMEYHIRPLDKKHATVLSVGHEAEFKLKKDRMFLKVADSDTKAKPYQIVAMQPTNQANSTAYHPPDRPVDDRPADYRPPANSGTNPPLSAGGKPSDPANDHPPQP